MVQVYRKRLETEVQQRLRSQAFPIVALLGPRQCGKSTLAKAIAKTTASVWFDLENPRHEQLLLSEGAYGALENQSNLIIIDEIQRAPKLFEYLRPLADQGQKFLILGSVAPALVQGISESLAGRVSFLDMDGFQIDEVVQNHEQLTQLWMRGGFPRSYLATDEQESLQWRNDFIRTYLERDLPLYGVRIAASTMGRFWRMLAHYHGQLFNASELGRSIDKSDKEIRRYLDVLEHSYVIRVLRPWFENAGKRERKSPKIYIRDSGLAHALLGVDSYQSLLTHPKLGASWEGFAINALLNRLPRNQTYFWSTHSGPEIDLLDLSGSKRVGYEFKFSDAPKKTRAMQEAIKYLSLDKLKLVVPQGPSYTMNSTIEVCALSDLINMKSPLKP